MTTGHTVAVTYVNGTVAYRDGKVAGETRTGARSEVYKSGVIYYNQPLRRLHRADGARCGGD